ncbi:hypothetical protein CYLTODRAFT_451857 [Cylindrobasidium torrendii FP15055 ss-10]|uniref:Uncharacterized protein n=1 Tax=Cylindrobasidium torrendii FP15055 ss-10 TaxID=1314674 RepID=A0A0D7BIL8_9AGAR|nr:hypothetical protein CYLTODRAFT_451857 [Cylindrobasidium torrendii FP15055 ss-10]
MSANNELGEKVRSAAGVIHGVGDYIRFGAMGALNAIFNEKDTEQKNENAAEKGREELDEGWKKLQVHPHSADKEVVAEPTPVPADHVAVSPAK